MSRARVTEALLAAIGTLAAAWPLTTLLQGGSWLWQVMGLVLLVSAVGVAVRASATARGIVVLAQAAALLLLVATIHLSDVAGWHGLIAHLGDLTQDAHETITHYAPPAPVTPGLEFVLALVVPALAIAVDFLAVTCRNPAAAGIPLLGVFMLSASNTATGLSPAYFVIVAIVWLSMLAHGTSRGIRAWASAFAKPSTPTRFENQLSGHASVARVLGIGTLALALVVPAVLPQHGPVMLGGGLGRSNSGSGHGSTTMFGSEEDIARDLKAQGSSPVLSFRTNDPTPPPLRVLATSTYHDGTWDLRPDQHNLLVGNPSLRLPGTGPGTSDQATTYRMRVTRNTLRAPQLAAPFPAVRADLGKTRWRFKPSTGRILPSATPESYTVSFEQLDDDARPSQPAGPPPRSPDMSIPSAAATRVRALAKSIGGETPFQQAIAIQDYLRDGQFTYSLTLAHRRKGPDGKTLDPLSNFLVTKVGYCTQFATAMVMLARADGIPARFAVGFLPGTEGSGDVYHVVRSDAHAWPELWFPGLGWTRFEPTPGQRSGSAPLYAVPTTHIPSSAPTLNPRREPKPPEQTAPQPQGGQTAQHTTSHTTHPWRGVGWVVLALLLAAALLLVLPGIAQVRRRRLLRSAQHPAARVEAEWTVLQWRLDDLGIPAPEGRSPRAYEDYYRTYLDIVAGRDDPLRRVVQTLENVRYAPATDERVTIADAGSRLVRDVRSASTPGTRIAAFIAPRTARRVIGRGLRAVFRSRRGRRQSR